MNILLIGMPGSGKSTIANLLSQYFPTFTKIEIDDLIRETIGCSLEDFINKHGVDEFKIIEKQIVSDVIIHAERAIISPGGSIVYYDDLMKRVCNDKKFLVIHLHSELDDLLQRTDCFKNRGVVMNKNVQFPHKQLYNERMPMYREYANKTFYTTYCSPSQTTLDIVNYLCEINEIDKSNCETYNHKNENHD